MTNVKPFPLKHLRENVAQPWIDSLLKLWPSFDISADRRFRHAPER
jgi:hypothetical protein